MANTFYKAAKGGTQEFLGDFARFLVNDLSGFTGPGWTIIDTYSAGSASPHEVPGTATDMDSLAADNKWRTNLPAVNDYIVLQANGGSTFQLGIEFQSATIIRFILAPLGGWSTGADNADMTTAGNWGSAVVTTVDMTIVDSTITWSVVANTSRFILFADNSPTMDFMYCGDLLDVHTGDTTNASISAYTGNVHIRTGNATASLTHSLLKLSAVDDLTSIALHPTEPFGVNTHILTTGQYGQDTASGEYRLFPVYLTCSTASHVTTPGRLDGVYTLNKQSTGKGSFADLTYVWASNNASYLPVAWEWDGVTAF
jgi:hypothetical protein